VIAKLQKIEELQKLRAEVAVLKTQVIARSRLGGIVGNTQKMQDLFRLIETIGPSDVTVLIRGESGTGKELVAEALHAKSARSSKRLIKLSCAAIPENLLEDELFGHEKGSFTGAITARKGRFEIAEGGTLFLDEIGDMSLPMQVKLLRVLQERTFERVGGHTPMRCSVRIIAATHRNLEESIVRGTFREDLFYRLNVFPIEIPALRERTEDLPLLIRDFVARNITEGRGGIDLTTRALEALNRHPWPGNVRELSNLVERLSILCPDRKIDIGDLPLKYRPPGTVEDLLSMDEGEARQTAILPALHEFEDLLDEGEPALDDREALSMLTEKIAHDILIELPAEGLDLRDHLFEIERTLIRQALTRSGGTVAHAARLLKLRRTTLVEKLRKFEMLNEAAATEV
jgi:sigma-54 specific flagellar transcriptional regulator A